MEAKRVFKRSQFNAAGRACEGNQAGFRNSADLVGEILGYDDDGLPG